MNDELKRWLPYLAVRLHLLDGEKRDLPDAVATGFVLNDGDVQYLYTAWHVVTGVCSLQPVVTENPLKRRFIRIESLREEVIQEGVSRVGGRNSQIIPLYREDDSGMMSVPVWEQDPVSKPHFELNEMGLAMPALYDSVRIPLLDINLPKIQCIRPEMIPRETGDLGWFLQPGRKCLVVGFPHGFSIMEELEPRPICQTKFVAGSGHRGVSIRVVLDSPCAPGMSGAPIFVEESRGLVLAGMYSGSIYSAPHLQQSRQSYALGFGSVLTMHLIKDMPFSAK